MTITKPDDHPLSAAQRSLRDDLGDALSSYLDSSNDTATLQSVQHACARIVECHLPATADRVTFRVEATTTRIRVVFPERLWKMLNDEG